MSLQQPNILNLFEAVKVRANIEIRFDPGNTSEAFAKTCKEMLEARGYRNVSQRDDLYMMVPPEEATT